MKNRPFHSAAVSPRIVRRGIADLLVSMVESYADIAVTGGRCLLWSRTYPDSRACYQAAYRLRKAGLLVSRRTADGSARLHLTPGAQASVPRALRPAKRWGRKWNGLWYVLTFDVPEERRKDRDALRGFLRRLDMGRLHRSVYVSPDDIRPEYADLTAATDLELLTYLFEAETVLDRRATDIIEEAWDWPRIGAAQHGYLEAVEAKHSELKRAGGVRENVETLAREEVAAYLAAMRGDPLLPRELWPAEYRGEKAYRLHVSFVATVRRLL
jgi:phenylacetic acid degradation operon negative regulatory protein